MNKISILPLGGLEEIGKNCFFIENNEQIVIIDCGLKFSKETNFGCQFEIPDFKYLIKNKKKINGLIITHGHLDHIGAITYLLNYIKTTLYGSYFTLELIKKQLKNFQIKNNKFIELKENKNQKIGNINFEPFNVNHSIIDSFGFIIDTHIKINNKSKIIHTGDFNIDPNPFQRKKTDIKALKKFNNNVLLLLSDSTNSHQNKNIINEKKVYEELSKIFQENKTKNKIVITTFSTQIPRILKIFDISKKYKRKIFLSGRSLIENLKILVKIPKYKYLEEQMVNYREIDKIDKITIIASGTQGEKEASIYKMSNQKHSKIKLGSNDLVVFSSSVIPGNEINVFEVWNKFSKNKIKYITPQKRDIHTSGHSSERELKEIIQTIKPQYFIPIHGESRHLEEHKNIALSSGLSEKNIFIIENGQKIEISEDKISLGQKISLEKNIISNKYKPVEKKIIEEKKELGLGGFIFVQFNQKNKIFIESYGVFSPMKKNEEIKNINSYILNYLQKNSIKPIKKNYENINKKLEQYFENNFLNRPKIIISFYE